MLLALIVIEAINAVRPVWTRRRAVIRLVVDACALALICALLVVAFSQGLITLAGPNLRAEAIRRDAGWITVGFSITLSVIAVAFVADVIRCTRVFRSR